MTKVVQIETGYTPRPLQRKIHNELKRFNVLVCHRRFGKTVLVINEMIDRGLRCQLRNPQFAYIAPNYGAAKRIAWDYVKDFIRKIPGVKVNEAELRVDIHRPPPYDDRIRFMLLGAENPGSLRGIFLDGAILDEFAECDPKIWGEVIRPALSDRKGWGIFIGTPKGQNHFFDIYHKTQGLENWYQKTYKASETGVVDAEELADAKATMTEEEYEQEYECSFNAALVGAYYSKQLVELNKKGWLDGPVPYDPALVVNTAWDLGIGDSTAIWFWQQYGNEIRIIDHYEASGQDVAHYAKIIKERNYVYDRHILPHDAAAKSLETGRTRQQALQKLGLRCEIQKRQSIEDGINAVRLLLPRCRFDNIKTKYGVQCLTNYQKKFDSKNKVFQNKPKHDWTSHSADAFRVLALALREPEDDYRRSRLPRQALSDYDIFGS